PKARELTLSDAVEKYLPYAARKLKASTYSGVVLHLRKHWLPLHAYELQNLERRHVAAELSQIAANSGPYGANRSRAALSALFAWAIGEGLTDANPVVGTNKATEETARDRVLSDNEVGLVWRHAGAGQYGAIVRLLLLTAQRREEVAAMQWSELRLDEGLWSLPASRSKNGRAHDAPLSQATIEILRAQREHPGRELVFGEGAGPFQGWSNAKKALDKRLQAAGMTAPWRLHDLRRTAATRMSELGVLPHVVEAVLNHISGHKAGVAGVYNRASYGAEKRQALDLWAAHVLALAEGRKANVVSLRRA
ncbi:MAG: site-specific integrase, partial [Methylocella sp.]